MTDGLSGRMLSFMKYSNLAAFSSMQNTAACTGGCRYSPMMSAAFCSKSYVNTS